jgi:general stress protein 26
MVIDKNKLKGLWFTVGVDDPELSRVKVTPLDCFYWDANSNNRFRF